MLRVWDRISRRISSDLFRQRLHQFLDRRTYFPWGSDEVACHDGKDDGLFSDFLRNRSSMGRGVAGWQDVAAVASDVVHRAALDPDALTQFFWIPCHVVTHRSFFCRYGKTPQKILKKVCVHHALQVPASEAVR